MNNDCNFNKFDEDTHQLELIIARIDEVLRKISLIKAGQIKHLANDPKVSQ
jgi:hypothetical protein